MSKIDVFIAHSEADKKSKDNLLSHLSSQKEDHKVSFWDRDSLHGGENVALEIKKKLEKADIILLLLSADFFSSNDCRAIEEKAFELRNKKKATVIPVMLRHFDLGKNYDSKTTIPNRKRPILSRYWHSEDEAFHRVAEIIRDILNDKSEGRASPHLKPPSFGRVLVRKLKRPAGVFLYFLFLAIGFLLLLLPKRNLPVEIKLEVSQVNFRLVKNEGKGLWSNAIFAKRAKIKNFSNVQIPGRSIRFLNQSDELTDILDSGIVINRLSSSIEPYLYVRNIYLSKWDIPNSTDIELRMAPGKSLFIGVDNGESKGVLNFNDSLELSTESSILKLSNVEYKNNLEAIIRSSLGRVKFKFDQSSHSISLDSLEKGMRATNLLVSELQFEKDSRNDEGSAQSSILSGSVWVNGSGLVAIENPETDFLKFESTEPLRIQKINLVGNAIELLILGDRVKDIQKGTSLASMESEMPTILEWLTTKYQLGLIAGLIAVLSPFIVFGKNLFKKSTS